MIDRPPTSSRLLALRRALREGRSIAELRALSPAVQDLATDEAQATFVDAIVLDPITARFPPNPRLRFRVLSDVSAALVDAGHAVDERLLEALSTASMLARRCGGGADAPLCWRTFEISDGLHVATRTQASWGGKSETGHDVWGAGQTFARWLAQRAIDATCDGGAADNALVFPRDRPCNVIELGSGTGIAGIALALAAAQRTECDLRVACTDIAGVVPNLRFNIEANGFAAASDDGVVPPCANSSCVGARLDWEEVAQSAADEDAAATWGAALPFEPADVDVIIGSDLVYNPELHHPLLTVVTRLLRPSGAARARTQKRKRKRKFLMMSAVRSRATRQHFVTSLAEFSLASRTLWSHSSAVATSLSDCGDRAGESFVARADEIHGCVDMDLLLIECAESR